MSVSLAQDCSWYARRCAVDALERSQPLIIALEEYSRRADGKAEKPRLGIIALRDRRWWSWSFGLLMRRGYFGNCPPTSSVRPLAMTSACLPRCTYDGHNSLTTIRKMPNAMQKTRYQVTDTQIRSYTLHSQRCPPSVSNYRNVAVVPSAQRLLFHLHHAMHVPPSSLLLLQCTCIRPVPDQPVLASLPTRSKLPNACRKTPNRPIQTRHQSTNN